MFTGMIEEIGQVKRLQANTLSIGCTAMLDKLALGDSIAVNGVCLTVIGYDTQGIEAEVMPVTLRATNLGFLKPGMQVNLERAMRLGDRLGGHLVSGHVDATASIASVRGERDALLVMVKLPPHLSPFVIEKGSIAIDGISLTIAQLLGDHVTVSLVGHTRSHTTLEKKQIGSLVNIECDQVGKYVLRFMGNFGNEQVQRGRQAMNMAFLQENGFGK